MIFHKVTGLIFSFAAISFRYDRQKQSSYLNHKSL